jgi:hypothetical protein
MTRREAIKLLKTEKEITALDQRSYLTLLALKVEIGARDLTVPLAKITKAWKEAQS